jgi:hypothetical protein
VALSRYRKFVYYPGVYLNFVAIAIFVEDSGGLVKSPFSAVLFALILGAQQLSRFKTNSRNYIAIGVATVAVLSAVEGVFGTRSVPSPPAQLYFWTLASALLLTALCTHSDKGTNYKARGRFPDPTLVELYVDDAGTWRLALHCADARLDTPLEAPAGNTSLAEAQRLVEEYVWHICPSMRRAAIQWRMSDDQREALGSIGDT